MHSVMLHSVMTPGTKMTIISFSGSTETAYKNNLEWNFVVALTVKSEESANNRSQNQLIGRTFLLPHSACLC